MPTHEQCYQKIGRSVVLGTYFERHRHTLMFQPHMGWDAAPLPFALLMREPVLAKLHALAPIAGAGILRTLPDSCYPWHRDDDRGVCVNLLLTPECGSLTLFGSRNSVQPVQMDIVRLDYEPDTFYLFNNQIEHTVINFAHPRFLFSIEFVQDRHALQFDELCQRLSSRPEWHDAG